MERKRKLTDSSPKAKRRKKESNILKEKLAPFIGTPPTQFSEWATKLSIHTELTNHNIRVPDTCLLHGPIGVGKTTLVHSLKKKLNAKVIIVNWVDIESRIFHRRTHIDSLLKELFPRNKNDGIQIVSIEGLEFLLEERPQQTFSMLKQVEDQLKTENLNKCQSIFICEMNTKPQDQLISYFKEIIHVDIPNKDDRKKILHHFAQNISLTFDTTINYDSIAGKTARFTGDQLKNIIHDAATYAVIQKAPCVTMKHISKALKHHHSKGNHVSKEHERYIH